MSARIVDGYEVFHWPEFLAFAKRCGVDTSKYIKEVSFSLKEGEMVLISVLQCGEDMQPDTFPTIVQVRDHGSFLPVATTNLQNKEYRTMQPHSSQRE